MKKLLQAGFGEPIGAPALQLIKSLGFDGVRLDCQKGDTVALVGEVIDAGLAALPILNDDFQVDLLARHPLLLGVELRNEPDLTANPLDYRMVAQRFVDKATMRGIASYVGVISNLTPTGLQWLKEALSTGTNCRVTIHRYPDDARFSRPHSAYSNRWSEVSALKAVIRDRAFGVSEFGYHDLLTQPSATWWKRLLFMKDRITPEQQLSNVQNEFTFWQNVGADFATLYQLNDGPPGSDWQGHYGIRRFDGTLKPMAQCCR